MASLTSKSPHKNDCKKSSNHPRRPRIFCKVCGQHFKTDKQWRKHMVKDHNFTQVSPGVWTVG